MLGIVCSLAGHRPSERTMRNAGYHFSRCVRCSVDLVHQDGRWVTAPRGFRIVWKEVTAEGEDPFPPAAEPAAGIEAAAEAETAPEDQRERGDRRSKAKAERPRYLVKERRAPVRDRRKGFGKSPAKKPGSKTAKPSKPSTD